MIYNYDNLKNYALWYYFRYFPSNNKLINKLNEKSLDSQLSIQVFNDIKHLLKEDEIIKTKIDNYISRNKNLNYIKKNFYKSFFQKIK